MSKDNIVYLSQAEIDRYPGYYNTWIHTSSTGDQYPETVDDESSPSTVYVRKNITPFEKEETIGDETRTVTGYEYDMMRVPRQNWEAKKDTLQLQAQVDSLTNALNSLIEMLISTDEEEISNEEE